MLELERELVVLVEEVVHLRENAPPLLLCVRQHAEHRLQALAVQLGLVVQILEDERQLLALRHAVHRKVEPGAVAVLLVRGAIMGYPEPVFVPLIASAHLGQVATAEVTVESDGVVLAVLELLGDALGVLLSQGREVGVCLWKVLWILSNLMNVTLLSFS